MVDSDTLRKSNFYTDIVTEAYTNGEGEAISVSTIDKRVVPVSGWISCKCNIDESMGVKIISPEGVKRVKNIEELEDSTMAYYVDFRNSEILFTKDLISKTIYYEYYGTGVDRMCVSRIYTDLDNYGNILMTLEDMTNKYVQILNYLEGIENLDTKLNELKISIKSSDVSIDELAESILIASQYQENLLKENEISLKNINELTNINNKSSENIDTLKTINNNADERIDTFRNETTGLLKIADDSKNELKTLIDKSNKNIEKISKIDTDYPDGSQLVNNVNNNTRQIYSALTSKDCYNNIDSAIKNNKYSNVEKLLVCKYINNSEVLLNNVFLSTKMDGIDSSDCSVSLEEDNVFNFANSCNVNINSNSNGVYFSINKHLTEDDIGKVIQFGFILDKNNLDDFYFAGLILWKNGIGSVFDGNYKKPNTVKRIDDAHYLWTFSRVIDETDIGSDSIIEKLYFKINTDKIPYNFNIMLPIAILCDKETNILDEIYKFYYFSNKKIGFNQSLANKIEFYNGYWKKSIYKDSLDEYSYLPIMNTDVNSRHCPGRTIGFYTNSSFVKLYYYGEGDNIEVRINGESSLIQLHNNSRSNWITIAEGLKGINKIEIIVKYRFTISGIEIESSSFITKNIIPDKKILFFGDSITNAGVGTSKPSLSFAYKVGEKLNMQSINQGIPGSKMHTDGLNRVDTDIVCDPNFIFILYGANDIGKGTSVEDFKSSYDLCIKNIKSKLLDCKIFIGTMIKRADESSIPLIFNSYQEAIKDVCKSNDCILIDTYEAIPDSSDTYYIDGIHPNDLGHEKISEFVANSMKKYI